MTGTRTEQADSRIRDLSRERDDMRDRFAPSAWQQTRAAALLAELPADVECVMVPLVMPGKTHNIWTLGQTIEHPDITLPASGATYPAMREAVEQVGRAILGERKGCAGRAVIERDGTWSVWDSGTHCNH